MTVGLILSRTATATGARQPVEPESRARSPSSFSWQQAEPSVRERRRNSTNAKSPLIKKRLMHHSRGLELAQRINVGHQHGCTRVGPSAAYPPQCLIFALGEKTKPPSRCSNGAAQSTTQDSTHVERLAHMSEESIAAWWTLQSDPGCATTVAGSSAVSRHCSTTVVGAANRLDCAQLRFIVLHRCGLDATSAHATQAVSEAW